MRGLRLRGGVAAAPAGAAGAEDEGDARGERAHEARHGGLLLREARILTGRAPPEE